ncbi:hypothetical protein KKF84_12455 [Myxococcota bacterium]|nr:hypothetical protein [Myxococcota bacterium]MBU1536127.1 hypothetical protein [Myxococcota bacterium]
MERALPSTLREWLWILPLSFWALVLLATPPRQDDIWWRLAAGDEIARSRHVPTTNGYSYTEPDHPWVDHAWGYDLAMHRVNKAAGLNGLHVVHAIALFLLGLLLIFPRKIIDLLWALPAVLLLWSHHALRPWAAGDLLFLASLAIAMNKHINPVRRLIFLFPLFLLWGNIHGSSIPGAMAVGFLLLPSSLSKRSISLYGATLLVLLTALLLNPYGVGTLRLALSYLAGQFSFLPTLLEWGPPPLQLVLTLFLFTLGLGVSRKWRSIPWRPLILSFLLLAFSLKSRRHIPLYVIASLLLLRFKGIPRPLLRRTPAITMALFVLLCGSFFFVRQPPIDENFYPKTLYERAAPHISQNTPVLTLHAWGGSLIYHFKGRARPFIDARNDCYPPKTFTCYMALREQIPPWRACLAKYPPRVAILPWGDPLATKLIKQGWHIISEHPRYGTVLNSP